MAEDSKITLFYMLAVAGLIISSILFTGRIEPMAEAPPATATPTVAKANATLTLTETDWKICSVTTQKTAFYMTDRNAPADQRLVISGTIYAADLTTPLPEVLIEVRPERQPGSQSSFSEPPDYLFQAWARTDAGGHYKAAVLKPGPGEIRAFYYRIRYQNRCPLGLRLFVIDEKTTLNENTLTKLGLIQGELAGPLLRGRVDLVLPVPPPLSPEAFRPVWISSAN